MFALSTSYLVVPRITKNIPSKVIKGNFKIPHEVKLADPSFQTPNRIDLLIGAAHFFDLLRAGRLKLPETEPVVQETCFGWVVAGSMYKPEELKTEQSSSSAYLSYNDQQETKLDEQIAKFWRIEEYKAYTTEEKACKKHFDKNTTRDNRGRFIVHLPFKENVSNLGDSYEKPNVVYFRWKGASKGIPN